MIPCPKCPGAGLEPTRVGTVQVDRCPECHGVWFDAHELPTLLGSDPGDLKPLDRKHTPDPVLDSRSARCPRDQSPLLRVASARKPAVILDLCPTCRGLWLDGGEFARLRAGK